MAQAWSEREVDLCVETYFSMLSLELDGEAYAKAAHRRELKKRIDRSDGSIEYKFQNISAVLMELGAVPIVGYKPAVNAQQLLRQRVTERLDGADDLASKMESAVMATGVAPLAQLITPSAIPDAARLPRRSARIARHTDFQAKEAANRAVGLAGELLVVDWERRRLAQAGRRDLADKVRHVSVEDGDGLGFDVESWTPEGVERFLEVKTTRYTAYQPFLVSRNEVEFSEEEPERFSLVRVFQLERPELGFYELPGSLNESADLRAESFSGVPRAS